MLSGATLRQLRLRTGRTQADVAGRIIDARGYQIHLVPRLDPEVQARKLVDVFTLAEVLP